MQLRTFLQISKYNVQRNEFVKNRKKIALPAQYYMYYPVINTEVLYIIVSIHIPIGNNVGKGHYVYEVLDYSTGTWWNFYDATITQYSGYPMNLYSNLSIDKKQ